MQSVSLASDDLRGLRWPLLAILAGLLLSRQIVDDPMVAAVFIAAACVAVAVARWPWIAFAVLVGSVPAQAFVGFPAGGTLITLTQLCVPLAMGAVIIHWLVQRREVTTSIVLAPLGLLIAAMLISIYDAQNIRTAGAETARWFVAAAAFVLALQFLRRAPEWRVVALIAVLAAGGVFEAAFGTVQNILALGPDSFVLQSGASRAFGTFGKPNSYAGFLEIVLFPVAIFGLMMLGRAYSKLHVYRRHRLQGMTASKLTRKQVMIDLLVGVALLCSTLAILNGILASLSRGAWLGVAAGAIVVALLYNRVTRLITAFGVPVLMILVLSGGAGILPEAIIERAESAQADLAFANVRTVTITPDNFAAMERLAHWYAGWDMFKSDPLTGVGIGNFNERYTDFFVREEFQYSRGHAHNYYIHTLAETGILGLLPYLTLIGGLWIAAVFGAIRATDRFTRALLLSAVGVITAVGVHNIVEDLHVLNLGITMSLIWAFVPAAYWRMRERASAMCELGAA